MKKEEKNFFVANSLIFFLIMAVVCIAWIYPFVYVSLGRERISSLIRIPVTIAPIAVLLGTYLGMLLSMKKRVRIMWYHAVVFFLFGIAGSAISLFLSFLYLGGI